MLYQLLEALTGLSRLRYCHTDCETQWATTGVYLPKVLQNHSGLTAALLNHPNAVTLICSLANHRLTFYASLTIHFSLSRVSYIDPANHNRCPLGGWQDFMWSTESERHSCCSPRSYFRGLVPRTPSRLERALEHWDEASQVEG